MPDTHGSIDGLHLVGTGFRDAAAWPDLVDAVGATTAAWADLGGFHVVPPPEQIPDAVTHLWMWQPTLWVRVRVDGGRWVAGILSTEPVMVPPTVRVDDLHEVVTISFTRIRAWDASAGEIQHYRDDDTKLLGPTAGRHLASLVPSRAGTATFLGDAADILALT